MESTRVPRNNISRTKKIILIAILVITSIILGLWLYWSTQKKEIIRAKIEEVVSEKSDGLYNVDYDSLTVDELAGNLSLFNMRVGYDNVKYKAEKDPAKIPSTLVKINIPELAVTGLKTPKALTGKELVGKKLHIKNPYIQLFYTNSGKDADRSIPTEELYKQLLGDLKLIQVDTIMVTNARIVTRNLKTGRDSIVFINTNLLLGNVAVDSISSKEKDRYFFAKSINFYSEQISWFDRARKYNYVIKGFDLRSDSREIRIHRVDIDPQLSEAAFAKRFPTQEDRLDIHFSKIHINNVDFANLMKETLVADMLAVGSASIKTFRDQHVPHDGLSKVGKYPHQALMKVPIPFNFRRASFQNTLIEYKAISDVSGKTGIVQFNNFNIKISNLTNEPGALRRNNSSRVELTGSLMNLIPMQTTMVLALGDKEGKFTIEGNMGAVDGPALNKLTEPLGMARIREGKVNKLNFNFTGNNNQAVGNVTVLYNDLKIDILEHDDDKRTGIDKRGFTSFLANLIIKDDNPKGDNAPRVAAVTHPREITRSFYNLIWKSILQGINTTIGNKRKMKVG